jgi:RNA polymerase sigma factor (sigma-70 family)
MYFIFLDKEFPNLSILEYSKIMERSDEELIADYIKGDQAAFKVLLDRYTPILYNFSVRFVGATNAADIVQEVFIKTWKHIKRFDISKAHFKTWVFTITRNTITDYLRKKKSITFSDMETAEGDSFLDTVPDKSDLPDVVIERLEDTEVLNSLLDQLPSHYREVLVLYYQEEMTFAEIGQTLSKPLNTVKSHHRRALEQLRKMVL